ncbi:hypothetical protein M0802_001295 [Mischocyttarus mexicanus]|nr:hypothetical protein M0802_001295 [Mischocyttarus mexicanus]
MNKPNNLNCEDRLKFLLSIMTENYENAIKVGTIVLKENPNDQKVLKILSAVKDKIVNNSLAESDASYSDEDTPNEENMHINTNANVFDSIINDEKKKKSFIGIDTNQYCQRSQSLQADNFSDFIKKYLLSRIGKEEEKINNFVFKEKMYRVILMKMNKNSN